MPADTYREARIVRLVTGAQHVCNGPVQPQSQTTRHTRGNTDETRDSGGSVARTVGAPAACTDRVACVSARDGVSVLALLEHSLERVRM